MNRLFRWLVVGIAGLALLLPFSAYAASAPTIFQIFLLDGTMVTSYGEYVRVGDDVVVSMPVGGSQDEPRLALVTLAAASVDWERTERYTRTARREHYASTRGEDDFAMLSNDVARVLNEVSQSTDRARAIALAEQARAVLVAWPQAHYGYRAAEVREILAIVEGAIAGLRGVPASGIALSLVASADETAASEPLIGLPAPRQQLDQIVHLARTTANATERTTLLGAALSYLGEMESAFDPAEAKRLRAGLAREIKTEQELDAKYTRLSQRLLTQATRAAADARVDAVETILRRLPDDDRRLGQRRPELMQALRSSVDAQLVAAQQLRLRRDQWELRRAAYRTYQRQVNDELLQLVKAQPLLDSIRRLDGPPSTSLAGLRNRLAGGIFRLQNVYVPVEMRAAHDLLVGAWRFAEDAAASRYAAVLSGDLSMARTASSAAAGAMMLLTRAQEEIRAAAAEPRIQ